MVEKRYEKLFTISINVNSRTTFDNVLKENYFGTLKHNAYIDTDKQ